MKNNTLDEADVAVHGNSTDLPVTDLIAEAITEAFGERCLYVMEGCPCCDAWAQYDALRLVAAAAVAKADGAESQGTDAPDT